MSEVCPKCGSHNIEADSNYCICNNCGYDTEVSKIQACKEILQKHQIMIETCEDEVIFFLEGEYLIDFLFGICEALNLECVVEERPFQNQNIVQVRLGNV